MGDSCVCVCGTNGKTTTNNLLCRVMEARGYHVVCNRKGANMPAGIASVSYTHLTLPTTERV